jgi:uncharacterized protein YukE/phosphotransferase system IIB component
VASVVEILARLKADSSQFVAEMDKAAKATGRLDKAADKTGGILSGKLKVGLFAAAAAAGAMAIKLGRDSVGAAMEASAAHDRLARLLYTTNGATEEGVKILNQQAKALENLTVVTESNITTVQSQLATFDLHGSTIAQLTPAILDYVVAEKGAAASADQYRQMTNGLAQALNGQFASLTAVGFVLDDETKKMIKSGTESERAAAIVSVLNSTYKDFAKTAGETAAGQAQKLSVAINNLKQDFGTALLPVMQNTRSFIASTLVPAIATLQAKFADKEAIEKFTTFMGGLLQSVLDFAKGIIDVMEPVFFNVLIPAFKLALGAVISFIKFLGVAGRFISKYKTIISILATVIYTYIVATAIAKVATMGYLKVMLLAKKAQQAYAFFTYTTTGATTALAFAQHLLNNAMRANPIGLIITAVALLAIGFKMLWDKSEMFRKIIIAIAKAGLVGFGFLIRVVGVVAEALINIAVGPLKLFLKALSYINPDAKKAYEGLKGMTDGVGKFFDGAAKKVEGFADGLDKHAKIVKKVKTEVAKPAVVEMPDLSLLGKPTGGARVDAKAEKAAAAAAKKLQDQRNTLHKAVTEYNDYLKKDFTNSFMDGAESASNAVMGALDKLQAVFEAKGKMLGGAAVDKLRASFEKVNSEVRGMIDGYAELAGEIERVSDELKKAGEDLADAIEERASAMKKFGDLMRTPFGEPSQIDKALRSAESSVDSIIDMYDQLVETVNQRFTQLAPGARDAIKKFLEAQAIGLIDAARMRDKAIKVLEASQKRLDDLVDDQKSFSKTLTNSIRSFATAVADLSKTDSKATISVIKTAAGLVITQLKQSSGGLDAITKQLKDRLATVATFATNAKKLLESGLNKEYVRQLLEAGPEAAGQAVTALAGANAAQIAEINSLYENIGVLADQFGTDISGQMYNEAVAMATAFRDGAALGVELINAAMSDIVTNINSILSVLGDTGLTNAQALIDALVAQFTVLSEEKVGPATQIVVDKIKAVLGVMGAEGTTAAQSFINGLLAALTGKDNLSAVDQSATQIKTNVDTIMKLLEPEALTSGLGLINSLVGAFGGGNLTLVTNSATAVKDSIVTALASLKTLGGELAADIAQGIFDGLTAEQARLVALAKGIADAIAAAMAGAAAGIGVIVDGASGDLAILNAQIAATADAAAALAGAGGTGTGTGSKTDDKPTVIVDKTADDAKKRADAAEALRLAKLNFKSPKGISPRGNANNVDFFKTPVVTKLPAPVPTVTKYSPSALPNLANYNYGRATGGGGTVNANVTINTTKVVPTVTSASIAKALALSTNTRNK